MSGGNILIDNRAETQWRKAAISFENFQNYIKNKKINTQN